MPANVFVSYDHIDQDRVHGFISLIYNSNHFLSFHEWYLKEPIVDRINNPLPYPPSDHRSAGIKREIRGLFSKATRMIVLVGEKTHESKWVNWEIQTFFDEKKHLSRNPQTRIRALRFKGFNSAELPSNLKNRSIDPINWDLNQLDEWLNSNVN